MKSIVFAALLAAGLVLAPAARAQAFGQYTPADILPPNGHMFGGYVDFSRNVTGLNGQLRMSFYPNVDFGFQGGLARVESRSTTRTAVRLGADLRFGALHVADGAPVDLAVGGTIGITSSDDYDLLTLGPQAVVSRAFHLSGDAALVPYVGMLMAFHHVEIGTSSHADFAIPLRPGLEIRVMPGLRIVAEFEMRLWDEYQDDSSFSVGVNSPF